MNELTHNDPILDAARRISARGECSPRHARDPVNRPMVSNWTEAIGDRNPLYADTGLAPPAMVQVWTMRGLHPVAIPDDPLTEISETLDKAGFTAVVATNCEQSYHRYLRHGERLAVRTRLTDVAGPKRTALGEGWFVTTESTWYSVDEGPAGDIAEPTEPVATMLFRVLKYKPSPKPERGVPVLRPAINRDTAFFWAGTRAGELRIQRCGECGQLRHPPGPMCPDCGAAQSPGPAAGPGATASYQLAEGVGEVYSYVVHHHPPVPGKHLPIVVALVQLPEGVRMVGELLDVAPERVEIGMPVRVRFVPVDGELTLPMWEVIR